MRYRDRDIRKLVHDMLLEGLRKKRDSGARRITGSPRVITPWVNAVNLHVLHVSDHLDKWYNLYDNLGSKFTEIVVSGEEPAESWKEIIEEDEENNRHLEDISRQFAKSSSVLARIGRLSDLTGDDSHLASVYAKTACRYERLDEELLHNGTFRASKGDENLPEGFVNSTSLTSDEMKSEDSKIFAGLITIILGRECVVRYREPSMRAGNVIGFRRKRTYSEIRGTISHEVYHLMQHLSDRALPSPGMYGRYGREGDRPGSESAKTRSGRKDYNQPIALEPDAYVISIVTEARREFLSKLEDQLRRAKSDQQLRNEVLDSGNMYALAKSCVEDSINMKFYGRDERGNEAFSGAGLSEDVKRYIRIRSLNAIERILADGNELVGKKSKYWQRTGQRKIPYTPYLDAERKRNAEQALEQARFDTYIAEVESLLEKMDQPMLDALAAVAGSIEATGENFAMQFYNDWLNKDSTSHLASILGDIVKEIDDRREAYTGTRPNPSEIHWIRLYIRRWVEEVYHDILERGADAALSDPLIPSRGAVIEDVEIGIRYDNNLTLA